MRIDIQNEKLISFAELATSLPSRRKNRPVHVSTIHRWRSSGICGIRLEAIRVGGAWHTTQEAFARFCQRLTAAEGEGIVASAAGHEAHQENDADLAADGW